MSSSRLTHTAPRLLRSMAKQVKSVPQTRSMSSHLLRTSQPLRAMGGAISPLSHKGSLLSQTRGIKTLDFGGTQETVYERSDYPLQKLKDFFKKDTLAVLGYGPQGRGQALNLRDNGLPVIVGARKGGRSWNKAIEEGWKEDQNLFEIEDAADRGSYVMNLLSDGSQKETWPLVSKHLKAGKTLYFSHGFSPVFHKDTGVQVPSDVDVILVAPKGSGTTVRSLFLEGRGINSSYAVQQDVSGEAAEKARALGVAIGSGYLYETTFAKEVISDLVGERGALMGGIYGLMLAQYEVLREHGHSPSEAFNETVEEATQSLYPLVGANGMDWMFSNCSTTAQRGALDWYRPFRDACRPVMEKLYQAVEDGSETRRSLQENSRPDYRERLEVELAEIDQSEMWRAGKTVRSLRPENATKKA